MSASVEATDERLIDLQGVDGEALKAGEAGVASSEIIDTDTYAERADLGEALGGRRDITDNPAFGNLEFKLGGSQAGAVQGAGNGVE